jgi:hypothetical protein
VNSFAPLRAVSRFSQSSGAAETLLLDHSSMIGPSVEDANYSCIAVDTEVVAGLRITAALDDREGWSRRPRRALALARGETPP